VNQQFADSVIDYFENRLLGPFQKDRESLPVLRTKGASDQDLVDALVEAKLIQNAGGSSYGIGEAGKLILAGRKTTREVVADCFGLDPEPLRNAATYFERAIHARLKGNHDARLTIDDRSPEDEMCIGLLKQASLVREKHGCLAYGSEGELVVTGLTSAIDALRAWWDRHSATRGNVQEIHFHEPVGAVAAGPGSVAHGTVNVTASESQHRWVDLQDELGELSDQLWGMLKRIRELELRGSNSEEIKARILELEAESFARRVKPAMQEHLEEVLKCVPGLAKAFIAVSAG